MATRRSCSALFSPQRCLPARGVVRLLWWLVLALALAPVLGQMHRVLHGGHALTLLAGATVQQTISTEGRVDGGLSALFTGHSRADCLWLDSVTLGDGPTSVAATLVHIAPAAVPEAGTDWQWMAHPLWAFEARAPPQHSAVGHTFVL
ncbi:MAG: hypothetical protein K2Q11_00085 [Burkholderiaceae bacterium]|nr:hypothetical protein [Burkholderiaceae bacterium]